MKAFFLASSPTAENVSRANNRQEPTKCIIRDVHPGAIYNKKVRHSLKTQRQGTDYTPNASSSGLGWGHPAQSILWLTQPSPAVHSYTSMQPERDRVMEFYETARVDGLIKREETAKTMTEYYQGRPDFLSYRHVDFGPRVKKTALNSAESNPRPVVVSKHWGQGASGGPALPLEGHSLHSGATSLPSNLSCFTKYYPGAVPMPDVPSATGPGRSHFLTVIKNTHLLLNV